MKHKAVVFDMDGLLLDSERIALEAFLKTCESIGFEPDQSVYRRCIGSNAERTKEILIKGYGPTFPFDDVMDIWREQYKKEAFDKPVPLKSGVIELLKTVKGIGLPMAIATSTAFKKAMIKLTNAGLGDFFNVIVAGDQVQRSKPDPEIYLAAASRLGKDPRDCLALEDSDNGVKSAHAAGMTIFQIPDLVEPSQEVISLGHRIVSSLLEVERYLSSECH